LSSLKKCLSNHGLKDDDILYYLHIPKTAGTTLISIIDGYFDRSSVLGIHAWKYLLPKMPLDFSKYRFVRGHYGYGFYKILPKKPIYTTVLRDPSNLIVSMYKMIQRQREEAERYSIPQDKTISELITNPNVMDMVDPQTHWLAVDLDVLDLSKDMDLSQLADYQPEEHSYFKHPDIPDDKLLEIAKKHLSEFAWVGIMEKFEESLFLLHYQFGWKPIRSVVKKNIAPAKKQDELTDEAKKKIGEWTKMDKELYRYGVELFESQYSKMVEELKEKYYEQKYENMEPNEAVFEMLKKHHEDHCEKESSESIKQKFGNILHKI